MSFPFSELCVCIHAKSLQSSPALCDPMDCSLPDSCSSILQTRILEWVACPRPGYLPHPAIELASLMSPALVGRFFPTGMTSTALYLNVSFVITFAFVRFYFAPGLLKVLGCRIGLCIPATLNWKHIFQIIINWIMWIDCNLSGFLRDLL